MNHSGSIWHQISEFENLDYIFSGVTSGKAKEGMILSSKGNEFYPHITARS